MVTFFNEPCNATDESALGVLRRTARVEDFVVFKLDIDAPEIEDQIVERILAEPDLHLLIDEFIFEYHAVVDDHGAVTPIHRGALPRRATVADAMRRMGELRRMGIRAHFWV